MVPRQGFTVVVVAEQARVEDLRNIAEARDLVCAGPAGEELAGASPERFFDGEEALALDEGAFDLAVIDCGVDRVADVLGMMSDFEYV